eukprot:969794-Pyramimonas_sp.AAC.1
MATLRGSSVTWAPRGQPPHTPACKLSRLTDRYATRTFRHLGPRRPTASHSLLVCFPTGGWRRYALFPTSGAAEAKPLNPPCYFSRLLTTLRALSVNWGRRGEPPHTPPCYVSWQTDRDVTRASRCLLYTSDAADDTPCVDL